MGLRGWSFIIFGSGWGGGGVVGHFMGGKVIFKNTIGLGGVFFRCESINWGVIVINFMKVVNKQ